MSAREGATVPSRSRQPRQRQHTLLEGALPPRDRKVGERRSPRAVMLYSAPAKIKRQGRRIRILCQPSDPVVNDKASYATVQGSPLEMAIGKT